MVIAWVVAITLIAVLVAFQLALAGGAPLGAAVWGGQHRGVLPTRLRIGSAVAGLVLHPLIAAIVLSGAGVIGDRWLPVDAHVLLWILVGFFVLGTLVNAISRSAPERLWSPVSAILAVCCAAIALG